MIAVTVGRGSDDDLGDTGDLRWDDGHHQRRRVGCRAARDVGTDACQRGPAALDLDAASDRRASRGGSLGCRELADVVDRLVEGATDPRLELVSGVAQIGGVEDQAAIGAATTHGEVGITDRGVATCPHIGECRSGRLADALVGDRAPPGQGSMVASGIGVAGCDRGEIEALQAHGGVATPGAGRVALIGRSSRSAGRGSRMLRPP